MFVVMATTATEADVIGVKSQILAEGMTPHEHQGRGRCWYTVRTQRDA